ncbi:MULTISPECIES: cytochrome o ubiquinol oxidase subunit IV [unclassified Sphingomonas]|jgi:cytochrome o ubiquinol oxidase subunit IV|uniref:cytochrome o ubiquinol oxidase subunit IV n=1 Tax=unclassified Sphingomonas TaxID=196159 RepID=UPI000E109333|nr:MULTISPECIES: cytochrome o ubiquinol oxidase subunit IV [unclassified Sphingomonas]AXJ95890.1 cytochrome o ubiquinol oxidase subunit IV [Sphingomonas sp. FARSPH]
MSAGNHAHGHDHGDHGHGDHAHGHDGAPHGSMRDYVIGFVLSVILTAIPFALVMTNAFADHRVTAGLCMAFALVQIIVHMIYFLHMNTRSENGWTLMALLFTVVIVAICLSGSLWVMYHMNLNMMPGSGAMAGM